MTSKTRLEKVSVSLSPTQALVVWMEEAHQYPTMVDYTRALLARGDSAFPLVRLPDQVGQATRAALRGQPREQVDGAVRQAIRDACFLYHLHQQVNMRLLDHAELLDVRLGWLIESFQQLLVYEVLAIAGEEPAPRTQSSALVLPAWATEAGHVERTLAWRNHATELLGQAHVHRAVVDQLGQRYFGGHQVLYPASAHELGSVTKRTEEIIAIFNEGLQSRPATQSASESAVGSLAIDLAAVRVQQEATVRVVIDGIVNRAKAAALDAVGERRAAHELIARQLQAP